MHNFIGDKNNITHQTNKVLQFALDLSCIRFTHRLTTTAQLALNVPVYHMIRSLHNVYDMRAVEKKKALRPIISRLYSVGERAH